MKDRKTYFLVILAISFALAISCSSAPKAAEPPPVPVVEETAPVDPNQQAPGQDALDKLNAARARAENSRGQALGVQGPVYFPDEWEKAESSNEAGKQTKTDTLGEVNQAIALFTEAADDYDTITEQSAPLFAKDTDDARDALNAAMARAGQSRQDAQDNQGPTYFPDDWNSAETIYQNGKDTGTDTLDGINAATTLYISAADAYDALAKKSGPMAAKDKDNAQKALSAAIARAAKSRQGAMNVDGQTYFPNDWKNAENTNQSAQNAPTSTVDTIKAATALYVSAADAYDDITKRSSAMFAKDKDDAQKALNAAIARATKSRQDAVSVDGQTYFPTDWQNAEAANQSAQKAPKNTTDTIKAATALYISAADAYDDITKKSTPRFTKDKDDAQKALNTAIARAEKSRQQATDAKGQTSLPNDWKNAETKNQTAKNAKRSTPTEIKAAVPLYTAAADAYDDITKRSAALVLEDAKTRAEKERQAAVDAQAQTAVAQDFNKADTLFQQAMKDYNAKAATAADRFNQSAPLFTAAAQAALAKRAQAGDAIASAKTISSQSIALATNAGLNGESLTIQLTDDEGEDTQISDWAASLLNNQYLTENARLLGLADDSYTQGKYDDAVNYAQESLKYAQLSDDYVALQIKIKEANDAIAAAQDRLEWAENAGISRRYAQIYEEADTALTDALDARTGEDWDEAKDSALRVISILASIPEGPIFAAQYLVKNWVPLRDCLWNIAARPDIYEDPALWRRIYTANRNKLPNPNNPDLVLPGTLLDIPSIWGENRDGLVEGN